MRSGYIGINSGRLWNASLGGDYWSYSAAEFSSATGLDTATAYRLGLYSIGVGPSSGPRRRWDGFPLRCLTL